MYIHNFSNAARSSAIMALILFFRDVPPPAYEVLIMDTIKMEISC